jgi:hypothetical protein
MIPSGNGIFIQKFGNALNGDIDGLPEYCRTKLNCSWLALLMTDGLASKNKPTKQGVENDLWVIKLLDACKQQRMKTWFVNRVGGSDPVTEANKFLNRIRDLKKSTLGGVIIDANGFASRSLNAINLYMGMLGEFSDSLGVMAEASRFETKEYLLKALIKKSAFQMPIVRIRPGEDAALRLSQEYSLWQELGATVFVPACYILDTDGDPATVQEIGKFHNRALVSKDDLPGIMWYAYDADPDKTERGGIDRDLDVRKKLMNLPWTRISKPVVIPTPTPNPPPAVDPVHKNWWDILTLEKRVEELCKMHPDWEVKP